MLVDNQR